MGCVPSKTLIHLARGGGRLASEILLKVRHKRDELRDEETHWLGNLPGVSLKFGQAHFTGPRTLLLDSGETLTAKNIVIATGSRPRSLEIPDLPAEMILTNNNLFELEDAPKHLVILGGGVIGTEMAFAFRRLGSRVSLVQSSRIMKALEPEASTTLETCLREAGVELHLGTRASHWNGEALLLENGTTLSEIDKILVAVGRSPNLDLDLEQAGVDYERRGIPTNHLGQTNVRHIYAIGDVNLNSAFTHSANNQGRRLVKALAFPFLPAGREPHYPSATFSEPEVAQVGPTLAQLHQTYDPKLIVTVQHQLKDTDRGYTSGLQHGFVMMHALRLSGRVLSATVVAPSAGEMIPILVDAVNGGPTLYRLANQVFPYPTLSEAIKKAADQFVFQTLPKLPSELLTYLRHRWKSVGG